MEVYEEYLSVLVTHDSKITAAGAGLFGLLLYYYIHMPDQFIQLTCKD